jgi:hypothetical protein
MLSRDTIKLVLNSARSLRPATLPVRLDIESDGEWKAAAVFIDGEPVAVLTIGVAIGEVLGVTLDVLDENAETYYSVPGSALTIEPGRSAMGIDFKSADEEID